MRSFAGSFSSLLVLLMLASRAMAEGDVPARLESVSILAARAGSSLALRTSGSAALVATTAADARTVVIELVGIVAERRDMAVAEGGMISRIAIETTGFREHHPVTRIRVSFVNGYRHRLRISGNLVYVDFENLEPVRVTAVASRPPITPKLPTQTPPAKAATAPARVPGPAALAASRLPVAGVAEQSPNRVTPEVNLLARWLAIAEPLQHTVNPPSATAVLARAWIPVVLKDGTVIYSYGEYAEVDGQVVFLLPFDDVDAPHAEAVSVPTSAVDLETTKRSAESVRAARYSLTRGPREFAEFSEEVSAILNTVPSKADPVARVNLVETVRRRLMEWPASHYGYRARDVNDAVSLLDPILGQLRAAAGVNRVDLSLVAPTSVVPPTMTFRQPTLIDLIENAMRLVSLVKVPGDRTTVLRATADSLQRHRSELPAVWLATGQQRVAAALKRETSLDLAYRKLSTHVVTSAVHAADHGDVRAISALQSGLADRDRQLGGKRPEVLFSTMTTLLAQFDVAARVQLRRDQQSALLAALRTYADEIQPALKRFHGLEGDLRQIARPSNEPRRSKMATVRAKVELIKRQLAQCPPPAAAVEGHELLVTAAYLAAVAVQDSVNPRLTREQDLNVRRIAAIESLAMFARGRQAIETSLRPAAGH